MGVPATEPSVLCAVFSSLHYGALIRMDFRWENQYREKGSNLTPSASATVFVSVMLPHFSLRHFACKSLSLENIHCVAISVFGFTFSWCEERESDTSQCLFTNKRQVFLKLLFLVKNNGCAPKALVMWFLHEAPEPGGVPACSWTCWYSPNCLRYVPLLNHLSFNWRAVLHYDLGIKSNPNVNCPYQQVTSWGNADVTWREPHRSSEAPGDWLPENVQVGGCHLSCFQGPGRCYEWNAEWQLRWLSHKKVGPGD